MSIADHRGKEGFVEGRYPYTYADDYVRTLVGHNEQGCVLSRSEASLIISGIAKAIDIQEEEVFEKIADAELGKSDTEKKAEVDQVIRSLKLFK